MLQQSWDDTRERISAHPRATAWSVVALVLVVLAVAIGASRNGGDPDPGTTVRADQSAVSLVTPTTFFGRGLEGNADKPKGSKTSQPSTGVTLRNGDGLHLYTATIPDYKSGSTATTQTTTPGSPDTTAPTSGGTTNTTAFPPTVFGGNRIAYVTNGQTWTINPDGTDARFVANSAFTPAWAPSHAAIAVVDAPSPGGILSFITPGGGRYALTPSPAASGEGDSRPTWSPDGQRLAFGRIHTESPGHYSSIWVINKDGQHAQKISSALCFTADPTWSPDGTQIVFWSSRDHCSDGNFELYVMNSDGSGLKKLGTATNSGAPSFSPDGTQIAYTSDQDGNAEIYVMNSDGSGQTRLTTSNADDSDPTWSPDGTRIAFSRNNTIFTMKPDGTDLKTVVAGSQPSWS